MIVGRNIANARFALGWSQDQLAQAAGGATNSDVSKLERGLVDRATAALREDLAARVSQSLEAGSIDQRAAEALARLQGGGHVA